MAVVMPTAVRYKRCSLPFSVEQLGDPFRPLGKLFGATTPLRN